ncbi:hypothetical protein ES705_48712 [subsurface metagenome]
MVFYNEGEKIECQHSEIIAKEIIPSAPYNHPTIGLSLKYKCNRNGSAEITKELEPKESRLSEDSNLNISDKLNAEKLYFIVEKIIRIKPKRISGHTGRHGSQKMNTKEYSFAEITKPFTHIKNALEKRKRELDKQKSLNTIPPSHIASNF